MGRVDSPVRSSESCCLLLNGLSSFRQSVQEVFAGCPAAWEFYDGVFGTVIPGNMKAIVDGARSTDPRLNQAFTEYSQDQGC